MMKTAVFVLWVWMWNGAGGVAIETREYDNQAACRDTALRLMESEHTGSHSRTALFISAACIPEAQQ